MYFVTKINIILLPLFPYYFSYERFDVFGTVLGTFFFDPRSSFSYATRGGIGVYEVSGE